MSSSIGLGHAVNVREHGEGLLSNIPVADVAAFEALDITPDVAPPTAEVALFTAPPAADVALLTVFGAEVAPDAAELAPTAAALLAPDEPLEAGQLAADGSFAPTLRRL